MKKGRIIAGAGLGAFVAAAVFVAPALRAQEAPPSSALMLSDARIGSFTPALADPKLAADLARSGLDGRDFRFTPADTKSAVSRGVSVTVQGRRVRGDSIGSAATPAAPEKVKLAPIAYNLGVSVGWKRLAISGDVAKIDLAGEPGSREQTSAGVSYRGTKFTGSVSATRDTPTGNAPALVQSDPNYSIDVGGSYSLTRNLDVTAGVRYKSEKDRLRIDNSEHRDSQAIYIGTAFRF